MWPRRWRLAGRMRGGAGRGNFDRGDLSDGMSAVSRRLPFDRLRKRLLAALIRC